MPLLGLLTISIYRGMLMTVAIAALSLVAVGFAIAGVGAGPDATHRQEVEKWRAKHEADYRREYVGLAGLFSLKPGVNSLGSAASNDIVLPKSTLAIVGRFVLAGDQVKFEPQAGVQVTIKGQTINRAIDLKHDQVKDGPDELHVAGVSLWVHLSGERRTIRMRDDNGEVARSFAGFQWFPIQENYRVIGRFIRDAKSQTIHIPNQLGDEDVYTTEGVVEFTLNGQTVRLRPMTTRPGRLYFIFRDGTSGKETYETARFLYSDLRADGTTVLDFNEAYNPPCAFNPFTTCPLPPVENRLTVRILAGEKAYPHPPKL
jgi:uncharacterized protein (DUF1684 family)